VSKSKTANQSTLIPALKNLPCKELFILTGGQIPLHILQGFIEGRFKPNRQHREILTKLGNKLLRWIESGLKQDYIDRKKYRLLQSLISIVEKDDILSRPENITYTEKLDEYINKYWDQVILAIAEK